MSSSKQDNSKVESINWSNYLEILASAFIQVIETLLKAVEVLTHELEEHNIKYLERKNKIQHLGKRGWHISPHSGVVTDIIKIVDEFNYQNLEKIDSILITLYKNNFDKICQEVISRNPVRKSLIEEAISAHNSNWYSLSITAFLSQSDGICRDVTKKNLFCALNEDNQKKIINSQIQHIISIIVPCYEFESKFDIDNHLYLSENKTKNNRPQNFDGLNRHQVMHGESKL